MRKDAFSLLRAGQELYQMQIRPYTFEEEQFTITARVPFLEATCRHCGMAVPPGLRAAAAFEWMICHLQGFGPHSRDVFADCCDCVDCIQWFEYDHLESRHRDYWLMKMWFGESDADDGQPVGLAYTPQVIMHEPSFAEGYLYHHVFDAGEGLLRLVHEDFLRKLVGGDALTPVDPVYGVCLVFKAGWDESSDEGSEEDGAEQGAEQGGTTGAGAVAPREDRWPVLLLSYCGRDALGGAAAGADCVDTEEFVSRVWEQTTRFADDPAVWEELSHFENTFMLRAGPHAVPVYATCTWCSRFYVGMPDLTPPWSEVQALYDSGAETDVMLDDDGDGDDDEQ